MGKAAKLRRKGKGKDAAADAKQETGDAANVEGALMKTPKESKPEVKAVGAAKGSTKGTPGGKSEGKPLAGDQGQKKFSGFIFMCNGDTKQDCFEYRVFGLPQGKKDVVEKINVGMKLFLFDLDLRLLYGVFAATSPGGLRLEPRAFKKSFPAQVRFRIFRDCAPLTEDVFKAAIEENFFAKKKFSCELSGKQVKKLNQLFRGVPRPRDNIGLDSERLPRVSGLYTHPFRTGYELDAPNGRLRRDVPYIDPYDDLRYPGVRVPEHVPPPHYGVDPVASELELRRLEYLRDAPPDPYAGAYARPLPPGEPIRKRALEEAHYLPLPKRAHLQEDLLPPYRDLEYRVAAPLGSYADDRLVSRYYAGGQW